MTPLLSARDPRAGTAPPPRRRPTGGALVLLLGTLALLVGRAFAAEESGHYTFVRFGTADGLSSAEVNDLHVDATGYLWVATTHGLNRYDGVGFTVYQHEPGDTTSLLGSWTSSIREDAEGALWLQHFTVGWTRFDPVTGTGVRFERGTGASPPAAMPAPADAPPAGREWLRVDGSSEPIAATCAVRDRRGTTWAGTHSGLVAREPGAERFTLVPMLLRGASGATGRPWITDLVLDRSGLVWIGTQGHGLYKVDPRQKRFHHAFFAPEHLDELDDLSVSALAADSSGVLWVGTVGRGLFRFDRARRDARPHRHAPGDATTLPDDRITCLAAAPDGRTLWVGTRNGLARFDRSTGRARSYRCVPGDTTTLADGWISAIAIDATGDVWIGTIQGGLHRLRHRDDRIERFPAATSSDAGIDDAQVLAITIDRQDTPWLSVVPSGLHRYDRATGRFERFTRARDPRFPRSLQAIHEDASGRMWLGTYSDGLVRLNPATGDVAQWSRRSGLPGNRILSIEEDASGRLWLGTDQGLVRFDPVDGSSRTYGVSHGVQERQFIANASARLPGGELAFGGIDGLNSFHPDSLGADAPPPRVVVTELRVDGTPRPVPRGPSPVLRLGPRERVASFDVVALDFADPAANRYAHRLEGLDRDWIDDGPRRTITYTNLDPGRYRLLVRGANSDGAWSTEPLSIGLVVEPPFWRTPAFLGGALLALLAAVWQVHRLRLDGARRTALAVERARLAEGERVRREAAIDFHDELGHLISRISLLASVERQRAEAGHALDGGVLDRIAATAQRLSQGMGDFLWMLDPGEATLHAVAVRLKDFGDHLFDGCGVAFRVHGLDERLEAMPLSPAWRRQLTLLFKEALHNTLKHARATAVDLEFRVEGARVTVELRDDGGGFDPERSWPGRGLASMRSRGRQLGIEVRIVSGEDGTRVTVTGLPAAPGSPPAGARDSEARP